MTFVGESSGYREESSHDERSGTANAVCNARECGLEREREREGCSYARRTIAFAPLARNGKCISVDRAQTKGRTLARGSSPSRFLPFRVADSSLRRVVVLLSRSLSRDISSANTRSRTVKGLTSQQRDPLASALALVTSKVHDVIPWKRSASKIAAWKWLRLCLHSASAGSAAVGASRTGLDFVIGLDKANTAG